MPPLRSLLLAATSLTAACATTPAATAPDALATQYDYALLTGDGAATLSIEDAAGAFCGFFILVKEGDSGTVEFRRILVDADKRGVGQAALAEMERYCREALGAARIWLDVFDDNAVGMHIYEKLGYRQFREEPAGERKLLFYEKSL